MKSLLLSIAILLFLSGCYQIRVTEKYMDLKPGIYEVKRVTIENGDSILWLKIPNKQYAKDGEGYPAKKIKFVKL